MYAMRYFLEGFVERNLERSKLCMPLREFTIGLKEMVNKLTF